MTRRYDTHLILRWPSRVNAVGVLSPLLAWTGAGGFPAFLANIFLCLATVGLILPNATAAAMAPFAHQAGVASALLGTLQFAVGALTGAVVGIFHDGTSLPMAVTIAGCGALSLLMTVATEHPKASLQRRGKRLVTERPASPAIGSHPHQRGIRMTGRDPAVLRLLDAAHHGLPSQPVANEGALTIIKAASLGSASGRRADHVMAVRWF